MSTVLITGSTGLIGSHLLKSVREHFSDIIYTPTHGQLAIKQFLPPRVDYIIHAAGYSTPAVFMRQSVETIEVNTETLIHLIERLNPNGSILFCSSSEVYK